MVFTLKNCLSLLRKYITLIRKFKIIHRSEVSFILSPLDLFPWTYPVKGNNCTHFLFIFIITCPQRKLRVFGCVSLNANGTTYVFLLLASASQCFWESAKCPQCPLLSHLPLCRSSGCAPCPQHPSPDEHRSSPVSPGTQSSTRTFVCRFMHGHELFL